MNTIDDAIRAIEPLVCAGIEADDRAALSYRRNHAARIINCALAVLLPADPNVALIKAMVAAMTAAVESTDEPFVLAEAAYDALRSHLGLTP